MDLQALEDKLRIEIDPAFFEAEQDFRLVSVSAYYRLYRTYITVYWYRVTELLCLTMRTFAP